MIRKNELSATSFITESASQKPLLTEALTLAARRGVKSLSNRTFSLSLSVIRKTADSSRKSTFRPRSVSNRQRSSTREKRLL